MRDRKTSIGSSVSSSASIGVTLDHAWVDFPIFDAKRRSLKKALLSSVGGIIKENSAHTVTVSALQDISLNLQEGDRVGLVGHNGAGKSTLLRVLSGIYEPTRGTAVIKGRVAPVFDLGIGMDPEISGFENIIIRGLFLGQTRKEMLKKVDDIAEFSELGNFLSMPLRTYSAGMRIRLALGVVTSIDPEILLLDEGIGAIDADFMAKARNRLQELVNRSGILVFASHSQDFLSQLCNEAIWLEHGKIIARGDLHHIISDYENISPHGGHVPPANNEVNLAENTSCSRIDVGKSKACESPPANQSDEV